MLWNVPNLLTILRIALIPVFVGIFYLPHNLFELGLQPMHTLNIIAASAFALASFTDWLDGYWARTFNQTSGFGAFLDPVADKLMVAAALIVLVELDRVGAVVCLIIIGREIAISALREWMASIGKSGNVAVAMIGKIKTAVQMLAILLLLYFDHVGGFNTALVGTYLIYISVILTLVSMAYYLKSAWPIIKDSLD
ncbi:MAG: CDP-diacylglycerol--glycerol-3-phosphate 3-phosphatidyltransferase [Methylophilaceae bacterium]